MAGEESTRSNLSIGDSIGLVSLLIALIAFIVSPSVATRMAFLLAATIVIVVAVQFSHWTRSWSKPRRHLTSFIGSVALLTIGTSQINEQLKAEHQRSLEVYISDSIRMTFAQINRPWVQRIFWLVLGALLLLGIEILLIAVKTYKNRAIASVTVQKGFLDYRLQAETAMNDLGPAVAPITAITFKVGEMIKARTRQNEAAAQSPTAVQLRVVKIAARKLDRFSRQIQARCSRLEKIGASLEEGMLGWFMWIKLQESLKIQLISIAPTLQSLCDSMDGAIRGTNTYIANLEAIKGISKDMNIALDGHIEAMSRVRNASVSIRLSCVKALQLIAAVN